VQRLEQQSPFFVHVLPAVLHDVLSAAHLPVVHVPLQQLASEVHASVSAVHAAFAHAPATQLRLQHSVGEPHDAPAAAHAPTLDAHVFVAASQSCEQQSAPVWHNPPKRWHEGGETTAPPPVPLLPPPAPPLTLAAPPSNEEKPPAPEPPFPASVPASVPRPAPCPPAPRPPLDAPEHPHTKKANATASAPKLRMVRSTEGVRRFYDRGCKITNRTESGRPPRRHRRLRSRSCRRTGYRRCKSDCARSPCPRRETDHLRGRCSAR
jgi:hypothetical protein